MLLRRARGTGPRHLQAEGIAEDASAFERAIDFRYYGQEYVLTIPLPDGPIDMDAVRRRFDAAYDRQYGHSSPENRVEMANIRVAALGRLERPDSAPPAPQPARPARARDVFFSGQPMRTPVLDRNGLAIGDGVDGPAIIEESTTTTLVPPGWRAAVIEGDHLSMTKAAGP